MKVLITGCSYSAGPVQSGWTEDNYKNHYSSILQNKQGWTITNRAVGGCSNREIALRTLEHNVVDQFDFCIVQWSSLHGHWVYEAKANIDNGTQVLPRSNGWGDIETASKLNKILVTYYRNNYMALKHWLEDQLFLQTYLQTNKISYVFVRAFPNFLPQLEYISRQNVFSTISQIDVPEAIKTMLDWNNNPDDLLFQKLSVLLSLYQKIDKSCCLGYNLNNTAYGFADRYASDLADNGKLPGIMQNALLAEHILSYAKKYKGLVS